MVEAVQLAAKLQQLRKLGGPAFVRKMIALFLDLTPQRVAEIAQAAQRGDLKAVEFAAHSLKSNAGNLGAVQVQELAERIESQAAAGQGEQLPALVGELSTALTAVITWLNEQPQESAP